MDMDTLMMALAKERGVKPSEIWMGGMQSYEKKWE